MSLRWQQAPGSKQISSFGERSLKLQHDRYKILRRNFIAVSASGTISPPAQPTAQGDNPGSPVLVIVKGGLYCYVILVSLVKLSWTQSGILLDSILSGLWGIVSRTRFLVVKEDTKELMGQPHQGLACAGDLPSPGTTGSLTPYKATWKSWQNSLPSAEYRKRFALWLHRP